MKFSLKSIATVSAFSIFTVLPVLFSAESAFAQTARGMDGSYVGAGVSIGVTNSDDDQILGGNVQGRLDIQELPISVRGAYLFNGDNSALMPILSYDIGIAPNTNLYVGGGYSFVLGNDTNASPLGNQNAPFVTVGAETAVQQNVVLYSDVKVGFDAYRNSSDTAVSVQVGGAYRF
jgi:hypothetical protein